MIRQKVLNLRLYPFSPLNAPNMGEANNLVPSLYMEPDPKIVNEYVGAVYICVESSHNSCIQRAQGIRSISGTITVSSYHTVI